MSLNLALSLAAELDKSVLLIDGDAAKGDLSKWMGIHDHPGLVDVLSSGRTDAEIIGAMLAISDSRFQEELMEQAKSAGKLPLDYEIPRAFTHNTPERLKAIYRRYHKEGLFPEFPLGSDFTYVEETLLKAMVWLRAHIRPRAMLDMARTGPVEDSTREHFRAHLERMGLWETDGLKEKLYQQLLLKALEATAE